MNDLDIEAHAESLAAKAIEGFCPAIYANGQYLGETYESHELVYAIIDSDDYPTEEVFQAVCDAACARIDEMGGPWSTEEDYAALTGRDEDHSIAR